MGTPSAPDGAQPRAAEQVPPLDEDARGRWVEIRELLAEILGEESGRAGGRGEGGAPPETERAALAELQLLLARVRDRAQESELRRAEAAKRQDELLGVVVHDLRTPLVAIQGFAQLLQATAGSGGLGEKQRTYVDRILLAVRAMSRMVDDLRTARQLDQGLVVLQRRAVEVGFFAEGFLEGPRDDASRKRVRLALRCTGTRAEAVVDPQRLGQALASLVECAVGRSPEGGEVTVTLSADRGRLACRVEDGGPPLNRDQAAGLFLPPGSASCPAKGMGLYLSRRLVALHGGRVGAEPLAGGGLRTWAEVPPPEAPGADRAEART